MAVVRRTSNRFHIGCVRRVWNLEQSEFSSEVMCAQANSASYRQWDGIWVVAMAMGEGLVWLIGAMVCLQAALWIRLSINAGNGWPHNALRHHWLMPISWHFRDCKELLVTSLTHVSGAITSVQTFTFATKWSCQTQARLWLPRCLGDWFVCDRVSLLILYGLAR